MTRPLPWILAVAIAAVVLLVAVTTSRRVEGADVDTSIAFALCTPEGAGAVEKCGIFALPAAYQVPIGRRLVIEQVSGDCADDGEPGRPLRPTIVAQTQGTEFQHAIIGVPNPDGPGGNIPLTLTRIYADGNSSVTIGLGGVPAFANRLCRMTFSGQLLK